MTCDRFYFSLSHCTLKKKCMKFSGILLRSLQYRTLHEPLLDFLWSGPFHMKKLFKILQQRESRIKIQRFRTKLFLLISPIQVIAIYQHKLITSESFLPLRIYHSICNRVWIFYYN